MNNQSEPILRLMGVTKSYGRKRALDGVTIDIPRGVIFGLLGPNGSGKSTLLKIAAGLVHADAGEVRVGGLRPGLQTKQRVAYLPELDHLYGWMTIKELFRLHAAFYSDWDPERADQLLTFMGLGDARSSKVDGLSKGMRARLKLVLVLSRHVPLILLDEPMSGIDPPSRVKIIQSLVSEFRAGEQTIVLSTHQVGEAEGTFDWVAFLREGRVRLAGEAEALRREHGRSIEQLFEV